MTKTIAKIRMKCSVCGAYAGRNIQHYNRDTGWGICSSCAAEQFGKETPERHAELYGKVGVNFEQPTVTHYGRVFNVLATFRNYESGQKAANAFMLKNEKASLLTIADGLIYLANTDDAGTPSNPTQ